MREAFICVAKSIQWFWKYIYSKNILQKEKYTMNLSKVSHKTSDSKRQNAKKIPGAYLRIF